MQKELNVKSARLNGYRWLLLGLFSLFLVPASAQELLNYPLDTINGEEVYKYRVERSIGLYRIGVNFNVSQSDIIRLNPQLRERGLHFDELLYIPTGRKVGEKPKTEEQPKAEKPVTPSKPAVIEKPVIETKKTEEIIHQPMAGEKMPEATPVVIEKPVEISDALPSAPEEAPDSLTDGRQVIEYALMLPFESQQTKRSATAARMMEFYQGVLLALRDIQNDSTLYRLRVYDVERSDLRVQALCDSTELDHVQGILGLVYPVQIDRMVAWSDQHQVPLLLPFSDNISLSKHPYVLQFNSTDKQEADSLCQWIKMKGDSSLHCVVIEVRDADLSTPSRVLRKQMKAHGITYTTLPVHDLLNDSAAYALIPEKENLIILHSDRIQHVRALLPHLKTLQTIGYRVRMVSQYSWQKENIALPQVYTSVFTSDMAREEYDAQWGHIYVNEHTGETPRYDLLGYDLMRALVEWKNGNHEYFGLQSVIRWLQEGSGGMQNAEVQVIEK